MNWSAVIVVKLFCAAMHSSAFPQESIPEERHPTADYINSLIKLESQRDASRNHDVAVIRFAEKLKNVSFDIIIQQILGRGQMNAVYIHSSEDGVPEYKIHAFSFFIIFSDAANLVRI